MPEIVLSNGWKVKVDRDVGDRLGVYRWWGIAGHRWCRGFTVTEDYFMGYRDKNVEWLGRRMGWYLHLMIGGVPRCFKVFPKDGHWGDFRYENLGIRDKRGNMYEFKRFTGSTKFKGVKWDAYYGLWRSEICGLIIGYYWNEVDAARAYNVKYKEIYERDGENNIEVMKEFLKNNERS